MTVAGKIERYAIRDTNGKFLAAYLANSEKRALGMFETDMARESYSFRRSSARINMRGITATPEAPFKLSGEAAQ